MNTTDYEKQAADFLEKAGATIEVKLVGNDYYFDGDKETRDIYRITIQRKGRKPWSFRFGQSIAKSGERNMFREDCDICRRSNFAYTRDEHRKLHGRQKPTAYDVLTCLQKYEVGTMDEFAWEFGYDLKETKISEIIKTYNILVEEYQNCVAMFGDMMEELREIQ